jgi:hypothetical protein
VAEEVVEHLRQIAGLCQAITPLSTTDLERLLLSASDYPLNGKVTPGVSRTRADARGIANYYIFLDGLDEASNEIGNALRAEACSILHRADQVQLARLPTRLPRTFNRQ